MSYPKHQCSSRQRGSVAVSCARILVATALLAPFGATLAQALPQANLNAVLEDCQRANGNAPRYEMSGCLKERAARAESALQEAEKHARQAVSVGSSATPQALKSLKEAQRAFGKFRAAECQRRADAMLGGSGAGDVKAACQAWLTYWYANQLQQN